MNNKDEEFLKRLQAIFKIEAEEHISVLSLGLIELEKNQKGEKKPELIERIFREAHSLKGAARSVNRNDIESLCQILESLFSKVKNENKILSAGQFDCLHQATDMLTKMLSNSDSISSGVHTELIKQIQAIIETETTSTELPAPKSVQKREPVSETVAAPEIIQKPVQKVPVRAEPIENKSQGFETVRIPTQKLDTLFLQAEQMIQSKISYAQRNRDLKSFYDSFESWNAELTKKNNQLSSESGNQRKEILDWNRGKLIELESKLASLTSDYENDQRILGRMIDEHLDSMKTILMLPISTILESFPKIVRDLARGQGKEVEMVIHGKETEVDKRILEELKDPLIHLIRNCIDHGIKKPEERLKVNKPAQGTITLTVFSFDGRNLEIAISDDGEGIDTDKVLSAAIKANQLTKSDAENLSQHELLNLVLKSGVSTSPIITDLSGRGLGLAILNEKVVKLRGSLSIESMKNLGTTFRIALPLNLSSFRGVLVRVGEDLFFIPTANVERSIRIQPEEIKTVENRETLLFGKEIIAVVSLRDVLGLKEKANTTFAQKNISGSAIPFLQMLVIKQGDLQIGMLVDEIMDEQQILVKELGRHLIQVRNISGATVLGSGRVVPVLNVSDMMRSALEEKKTKVSGNTVQAQQKIFRILVVEDSITSRTLVKDILENAGYIAETAVDGMDGFMKASIGEYDLIISDVDMPRMNGFELTTKIRNNQKLKELPVVMITSLDSREDREHGIDVGADAYIVKSSFNQSNLLDVIRKLL